MECSYQDEPAQLSSIESRAQYTHRYRESDHTDLSGKNDQHVLGEVVHHVSSTPHFLNGM